MLNQQIDYASLVEQALLRVVRDVLGMVAEHGMPGRHHLYITFRTDHPGVVMDDVLHARYPSEMTIVLQHEFWGLEVSDDRFAVTLSFNNVSQRLDIPFAAVTVFADPSVEFGLQFTRASAAAESLSSPLSEAGPPSPGPAPVAKLPAAAESAPGPASAGEGPVPIDEAAKAKERGEQGADKVVTLDRFRKK
ncbi:MAG: SspB family protein [Geminicoccales bacterium]